MPEFISKLQYKTSEKGEYYDEKPRDLDTTLALIGDFPWAREQYAHLGLTGPSVTILDDKGNFLKASIYYGGRFTVYYLDTKHHYYELRNISMETVVEKVTEFFSYRLALDNFEKKSLSFVKSFFLTNPYEYRVKLWRVCLLSLFYILYFLLVSSFVGMLLIAKRTETDALLCFGVLFSTFFITEGYFVVRIFTKYPGMKNRYLKITRGNDEFLFGDKPGDIKCYNKNDIDKITHFYDKNRRSPNEFEIFEITFKNGTFITFSNILISFVDLSDKFSDKWKFPVVKQKQSWFHIMRNLE